MGNFFHFSSCTLPHTLIVYVLAYLNLLNFKAVLAIPKTAGSAQTHKIELFGALYMHISGGGHNLSPWLE